MGRPCGILVIDDDTAALGGLLELLRSSGYSVTGAATLEAGRRLLDAIPFDLLVIDVRLRDHSGLTLVRMTREEHPAMGVIVVTGFPDEEDEEEALRLGATYMTKPIDLPRLLAIVDGKVSSASKQRRWPRRRVAGGGFGASVADAPGRVVDMSYGGFRFEMPAAPEGDLPSSVELKLLPFGLSIAAELVWASRVDASGGWTCGAAVAETDWSTARAWRVVVDALSKTD